MSFTLGNVFYDFIGFNFIDEIIVLLLVLYYAIYKTVNRIQKIDKELFILLFIVLFYLFYSIMIKRTVISAIFADLQQQIKPFLAFYCTYNLLPYFSKTKKQFICFLCILLGIILIFIVTIGKVRPFFSHVTNLASAALVLSYTYYFFSDKKTRDMLVMLLLLSLGLLSFRSKFYGIYVSSIAILFFVKSQIKINIKTICLISILIVAVLFFAWEKFDFYFVSGLEKENLARPILYKNAFSILSDYFPFGSGFGTYGNEASRNYYSPLYYEYNMDNVWGLSPEMPEFVADTYYPTLAQFGIIGIFLFFLFWVKIYRKIISKLKSENDFTIYKLSLLIMIAIFIESVADTMLISNRGVAIMMLLAIIIVPKNIEK